jgi:hypothetical protein
MVADGKHPHLLALGNHPRLLGFIRGADAIHEILLHSLGFCVGEVAVPADDESNAPVAWLEVTPGVYSHMDVFFSPRGASIPFAIDVVHCAAAALANDGPVCDRGHEGFAVTGYPAIRMMDHASFAAIVTKKPIFALTVKDPPPCGPSVFRNGTEGSFPFDSSKGCGRRACSL